MEELGDQSKVVFVWINSGNRLGIGRGKGRGGRRTAILPPPHPHINTPFTPFAFAVSIRKDRHKVLKGGIRNKVRKGGIRYKVSKGGIRKPSMQRRFCI
jgi:hypothetical protein